LSALLASVVLTVVSCQDSYSALRNELDQNRQVWNNQKITHYRYELRVLCFCPTELTAPVKVEAKDGNTISLKYVASGEDVKMTEFQNYDTMDKMFKVIQDAIDRKAAEITAKFDSKLGFPASIRIDNIEQAIDDEISFEITNVEVLAK